MITTRFSAEGKRLRPLASASVIAASGGVSAVKSRGDLLSQGHSIQASLVPGTGMDIPMLAMPNGGLGYSKFFTSILPDAEESLIPYYRDCYYFDSVAGATVDILSVFPFSDWTLVGLEKDETEIFNESMSQLNIRSLMGEVSKSYLVDGAFIGSLVYDAHQKAFHDILVHDRLNCQISLRPFFTQDPVIHANAAANLNNFLDSGSPYVEEVMKSYPRDVIEVFRQGQALLDPITTLYVPRAGMSDQRTTSYLRRILPMYLLEKTLYRGTLLEATKRMRAMSHIQIGTDTWEPTPAEMQTVLAQFQLGEIDPLGGWIATRQGVQVQDIRQGGDFWKWTDLIDTLVPYKLRALGISEAFLAGDANFSNAEAAIQVFMESCAAYRSYLCQKVFREKLFPLIAASRGLYIDGKKAIKGNSPHVFLKNLRNHRNLKLPELHWHKKLDNYDPQQMELLTALGEKGIPIPLKMWAAASGVDLRMLLGDLGEDQELRAKIEAVTGKKMDDGAGDPDLGGNDDGMGYEEASLRELEQKVEVRSTKHPILSQRRSILQRNFHIPPLKLSKSGKKVHSLHNEHLASKRYDSIISKAILSLQDPHRQHTVRSQIKARNGGRMPLIDPHHPGR